MVIYFTGTGNSRFVATEIAKNLHDTCICANESIKREKKGSFRGRKPWVFVFPVYLSTIPKIFVEFLNSSRFEGHRDAYFIATCASSSGSVPNACKEFCARKGLHFMGADHIQMPQNYIALFKMTPAEECDRRLSAALDRTHEISYRILKGKHLSAHFASSAEYTATKIVEKLYNRRFTKTKKFYATDACIGCGLCVKLCPLNRITLKNGKPEWTGSCTHCMGCINHCPKHAIEYGKNTIGKQRYVCKIR